MSEHAVNSLPLQRTAEVPFAAYKRQQAALARRRLYPVTAFYTLYAILVLAIAFSTKHPWIAVVFFFRGMRDLDSCRIPFPPLRFAWSIRPWQGIDPQVSA